MDIQTIIAFTLLVLSAGYIFVKMAGKHLPWKKSDDSCGPNCNCG